MRTGAKTTTPLLALLLLSVALPALGQGIAPPAPLPVPEATETFSQYLQRLTNLRAGAAADADAVEKATAKTVAAKTTATAAPEGFAGRVNDSISDFLPFFQFAVNSVSTSEDEKSVILKLKPFELGGYGPVSVAATATEPAVFSPFAETILEPAREAEVKLLLAGVDDFSDVTWTAEYGYTRPARSWDADRKLFGRKTATYKPLIQELLAAALNEVFPEQAAEASAFAALAPEILVLGQKIRPDVRSITFGEIRDLIAREPTVGFTEEDLKDKLSKVADRSRALQDKLSALNLAKLPNLIDNQPQLVLKASYRDADEVVGPRAQAYTLTYEMGTRNLNAVLGQYRALRAGAGPAAAAAAAAGDLRLRAFTQVTADEVGASEDRFVFSLTYKDTDPYSFSHDYTETVTAPETPPLEVSRTASLSLPGSTEWVGRLTWTRYLRSPKLRSTDLPHAEGTQGLLASLPADPEEKPRLSFTLEHCQASGNSKLQDRTVGRLTLTLPSAGNTTLPISITYADKAEFLGQQDKTFGAHIGLSYKVKGGD